MSFEPDPYIETLKDRVDSMTGDQLIYLFVPEMLAMKELAEMDKEIERVIQIEEVLAYVRTKVELDSFSVYDDIERVRYIVPSPEDIINGKTKGDIPNN
jgi:hypothetical protein